MKAIFYKSFLDDLAKENNIEFKHYSLGIGAYTGHLEAGTISEKFDLSSLWDSEKKILKLSLKKGWDESCNIIYVYYAIFDQESNNENIAFVLINNNFSEFILDSQRNFVNVNFSNIPNIEIKSKIITNFKELDSEVNFLEGVGVEVGENIFRDDLKGDLTVAKDSYQKYILSNLTNSKIYGPDGSTGLDIAGKSIDTAKFRKVYKEDTFTLGVFDETYFINISDEIKTKYNLPREISYKSSLIGGESDKGVYRTLKLTGSIEYDLYYMGEFGPEYVGTKSEEITGIDGVKIINVECSMNELNTEETFVYEIDNLLYNIRYFTPNDVDIDDPMVNPYGIFVLELSYEDLGGTVKTIRSNKLRLIQGGYYGYFSVINSDSTYTYPKDDAAMYLFGRRKGERKNFTVRIKSSIFTEYWESEDLSKIKSNINFEFENEYMEAELKKLFNFSYTINKLEELEDVYDINVEILSLKNNDDPDHWLPYCDPDGDGVDESTLSLIKLNIDLDSTVNMYYERFYCAQGCQVNNIVLVDLGIPNLTRAKVNPTAGLVYGNSETQKTISITEEYDEKEDIELGNIPFYWKVITIPEELTITQEDSETPVLKGEGEYITEVENYYKDSASTSILTHNFNLNFDYDKFLGVYTLPDTLTILKQTPEEYQDDVDIEDTWETYLTHNVLKIPVKKEGIRPYVDIEGATLNSKNTELVLDLNTNPIRVEKVRISYNATMTARFTYSDESVESEIPYKFWNGADEVDELIIENLSSEEEYTDLYIVIKEVGKWKKGYSGAKINFTFSTGIGDKEISVNSHDNFPTYIKLTEGTLDKSTYSIEFTEFLFSQEPGLGIGVGFVKKELAGYISEAGNKVYPVYDSINYLSDVPAPAKAVTSDIFVPKTILSIGEYQLESHFKSSVSWKLNIDKQNIVDYEIVSGVVFGVNEDTGDYEYKYHYIKYKDTSDRLLNYPADTFDILASINLCNYNNNTFVASKFRLWLQRVSNEVIISSNSDLAGLSYNDVNSRSIVNSAINYGTNNINEAYAYLTDCLSDTSTDYPLSVAYIGYQSIEPVPAVSSNSNIAHSLVKKYAGENEDLYIIQDDRIFDDANAKPNIVNLRLKTSEWTGRNLEDLLGVTSEVNTWDDNHIIIHTPTEKSITNYLAGYQLTLPQGGVAEFKLANDKIVASEDDISTVVACHRYSIPGQNPSKKYYFNWYNETDYLNGDGVILGVQGTPGSNYYSYVITSKNKTTNEVASIVQIRNTKKYDENIDIRDISGFIQGLSRDDSTPYFMKKNSNNQWRFYTWFEEEGTSQSILRDVTEEISGLVIDEQIQYADPKYLTVVFDHGGTVAGTSSLDVDSDNFYLTGESEISTPLEFSNAEYTITLQYNFYNAGSICAVALQNLNNNYIGPIPEDFWWEKKTGIMYVGGVSGYPYVYTKQASAPEVNYNPYYSIGHDSRSGLGSNYLFGNYSPESGKSASLEYNKSTNRSYSTLEYKVMYGTSEISSQTDKVIQAFLDASRDGAVTISDVNTIYGSKAAETTDSVPNIYPNSPRQGAIWLNINAKYINANSSPSPDWTSYPTTDEITSINTETGTNLDTSTSYKYWWNVSNELYYYYHNGGNPYLYCYKSSGSNLCNFNPSGSTDIYCRIRTKYTEDPDAPFTGSVRIDAAALVCSHRTDTFYIDTEDNRNDLYLKVADLMEMVSVGNDHYGKNVGVCAYVCIKRYEYYENITFTASSGKLNLLAVKPNQSTATDTVIPAIGEVDKPTKITIKVQAIDEFSESTVVSQIVPHMIISSGASTSNVNNGGNVEISTGCVNDFVAYVNSKLFSNGNLTIKVGGGNITKYYYPIYDSQNDCISYVDSTQQSQTPSSRVEYVRIYRSDNYNKYSIDFAWYNDGTYYPYYSDDYYVISNQTEGGHIIGVGDEYRSTTSDDGYMKYTRAVGVTATWFDLYQINATGSTSQYYIAKQVDLLKKSTIYPYDIVSPTRVSKTYEDYLNKRVSCPVYFSDFHWVFRTEQVDLGTSIVYCDGIDNDGSMDPDIYGIHDGALHIDNVVDTTKVATLKSVVTGYKYMYSVPGSDVPRTLYALGPYEISRNEIYGVNGGLPLLFNDPICTNRIESGEILDVTETNLTSNVEIHAINSMTYSSEEDMVTDPTLSSNYVKYGIGFPLRSGLTGSKYIMRKSAGNNTFEYSLWETSEQPYGSTKIVLHKVYDQIDMEFYGDDYEVDRFGTLDYSLGFNKIYKKDYWVYTGTNQDLLFDMKGDTLEEKYFNLYLEKINGNVVSEKIEGKIYDPNPEFIGLIFKFDNTNLGNRPKTKLMYPVSQGLDEDPQPLYHIDRSEISRGLDRWTDYVTIVKPEAGTEVDLYTVDYNVNKYDWTDSRYQQNWNKKIKPTGKKVEFSNVLNLPSNELSLFKYKYTTDSEQRVFLPVPEGLNSNDIYKDNFIGNQEKDLTITVRNPDFKVTVPNYTFPPEKETIEKNLNITRGYLVDKKDFLLSSFPGSVVELCYPNGTPDEAFWSSYLGHESRSLRITLQDRYRASNVNSPISNISDINTNSISVEVKGGTSNVTSLKELIEDTTEAPKYTITQNGINYAIFLNDEYWVGKDNIKGGDENNSIVLSDKDEEYNFTAYVYSTLGGSSDERIHPDWLIIQEANDISNIIKGIVRVSGNDWKLLLNRNKTRSNRSCKLKFTNSKDSNTTALTVDIIQKAVVDDLQLSYTPIKGLNEPDENLLKSSDTLVFRSDGTLVNSTGDGDSNNGILYVRTNILNDIVDNTLYTLKERKDKIYERLNITYNHQPVFYEVSVIDSSRGNLYYTGDDYDEVYRTYKLVNLSTLPDFSKYDRGQNYTDPRIEFKCKFNEDIFVTKSFNVKHGYFMLEFTPCSLINTSGGSQFFTKTNLTIDSGNERYEVDNPDDPFHPFSYSAGSIYWNDNVVNKRPSNYTQSKYKNERNPDIHYDKHEHGVNQNNETVYEIDPYRILPHNNELDVGDDPYKIPLNYLHVSKFEWDSDNSTFTSESIDKLRITPTVEIKAKRGDEEYIDDKGFQSTLQGVLTDVFFGDMPDSLSVGTSVYYPYPEDKGYIKLLRYTRVSSRNYIVRLQLALEYKDRSLRYPLKCNLFVYYEL